MHQASLCTEGRGKSTGQRAAGRVSESICQSINCSVCPAIQWIHQGTGGAWRMGVLAPLSHPPTPLSGGTTARAPERTSGLRLWGKKTDVGMHAEGWQTGQGVRAGLEAAGWYRAQGPWGGLWTAACPAVTSTVSAKRVTTHRAGPGVLPGSPQLLSHSSHTHSFRLLRGRPQPCLLHAELQAQTPPPTPCHAGQS